MTRLTIDLRQKTITQSGELCIRESAEVVLVNAGNADAIGLRMRIFDPFDGSTLAKCDSFVDIDGEMDGTVDMSGESISLLFSGLPATKKLRLGIQVWNLVVGNESLLINDIIHVMNNPYTSEMESQTP